METENTAKREIHLYDYLAVLDRRKWIIIAAIIVTLVSTYWYIRRQKPVYQAQVSIIIEEPQKAQETVLPSNVNVATQDWMYLETQLEVIKTNPVMAQAVRLLAITSEPEGSPEFNNAVNMIKGSVSVKPVTDTRIVKINAVSNDAEKAQAIANAVAQAYIEQDRLSRLQSGRESVKWLNTQLVDLKMKIRKSEEAFQKFKEREDMISLDEKQGAELSEISKLNSGYIVARTERLEIESISDKLNNENDGGQSIPVALLDNPVLQKLGSELNSLQADLADKRRIFKDTYPEVIKLKDRINLTEQNIVMELKKQRDFLRNQEESFIKQLDAKRQDTLKLGKKEMDYLALEREVMTNREMYNALLAKVKELSIVGEIEFNNIRIIEPAPIPGNPSNNRKMTLLLGGVLGLFLGLGFAFLLEYLEYSIRTPDDVKQHLGINVLGIIPRIASAKKERKRPPLVMESGKKDPSAEAFRTIRTNLLAAEIDDPVKTMLITSATPGEGKSLMFVNLGLALAQAGKNVLLVDTDLRRPMVHRVFKLNRHRGLTKILNGDLSMDEAIVKMDIPNLSILTTGTLPTNPSEVLGSPEMKQFIKYVSEDYDIVLFDSAPILGMADASILAAEMDAAMMVIKTGSSTRKAIEVALEQLNKSGVRMAGAVLNNADVKRDRYYNYYSYYYAYEEESGRKVKRRRKNEKSRRSPVAASQKVNVG